MKRKIKMQHVFNRNLIKVIFGILITVLLLIPMNMINKLISERNQLHKQVQNEISTNWGKTQTLQGPYIVVPYAKEDSSLKIVGSAIFLSENLTIQGNIQPEYKHRGIYKFVVYTSDFNISGTYKSPNDKTISRMLPHLADKKLLWEKAQLKFFISETKGLTNNVTVNWNDTSYDVFSDSRSIQTSPIIPNMEGFACNIKFNPDIENKFSFSIKIKGSGEISFIPLGKFTKIDIKSPWETPKFVGNYLPDSREITKQGFDAHWNISHLNRPVSQIWDAKTSQNISRYSFGVQLIEPVNKYLKTIRAAKYAILFILLTFISLFFVELFTKQAGNILQYILTGFALILFYSILLSLTEQMSFDMAYLISSISIIGLITAYSYSISKNIKASFVLFILWTILYGFLFFILQLEELALLAGNIGLFIILAGIMFASRKIKFNLSKMIDDQTILNNKIIEDENNTTVMAENKSDETKDSTTIDKGDDL